MLLAAVLILGTVGGGSDTSPAPLPADLTIGTSYAATASAPMANIPIPSPTVFSDPQQVLLALINSERVRGGLQPLKWDERMHRAAMEHALLMSREGRLSHQFDGEPNLSERLLAQHVRLDQAGENVVYDWSVKGAHESFMGSPHHLANMMRAAYDSAGIAIVNADGILYVVEDFAHAVPDLSDEAAVAQIAGRFVELRLNSGGSELTFVSDEQLKTYARSMAEHEALDSASVLQTPGVRYAASYATADPASIPAQVASLAAQQGVSTYSVAVHFARTPKYPGGLFWVAVVLYDANTVAKR